MLAQLRIKNLAIVEDVRIEFGKGLNIITGQTGAGKSILLAALGLVTGQKASPNLIRTGEKSCVIEASFDFSQTSIPKRIGDEVLSGDEDVIVIKRELFADGKSRAYANGQLVNLSALKSMGDALMEIHSQRDTHSLYDPSSQKAILDELGHCQVMKSKVASAYEDYKTLVAQKERICDLKKNQSEKMGWMKFQYDEIKKAQLREGEEEDLIAEKDAMGHFEDIHTIGRDIVSAINDGEPSWVMQLSEISKKVKELSRLDARFEETAKIFEECSYSLSDAAAGLTHNLSHLTFDPARMEWLQERLYLYQSLKKKYSKSVAELIDYKVTLQKDMECLTDEGGYLEELDKNIKHQEKILENESGVLSRARADAARKLARDVTKILSGLGMPHAAFSPDISRSDYTAEGFDDVEFMLAPNPGEKPLPLRDIASGGETSRVLLAIKSVISEVEKIPVTVFDEIDSNVGGEIAVAVGEKIKSIAKTRQVLCVTHLPQIACLSGTHFNVSKRVSQGRTIVVLEKLEGEKRISEMARMLGGEELTSVTRQHARELLKVHGRSV